MSKLFRRNIETKGRILRAVIALVLLIAAIFTFPQSKWLAIALLACAIFTAFEAAAGWCALRSCGVKTKL